MKKNKLFLILFALLAFGPKAWAQNIVSVNYVDETGATQTVNATVLDDIINADPNSDKSIGYSNVNSTFVVQGGNVVLNAQLGYNGNVNLILCDGAKLTINTTGKNALQSLDDLNNEAITQLTIYGQTNGTGQLIATATTNDYESVSGICTEKFTINRGVISATGRSRGIHTNYSLLTINGGTVTAVATNGTAIEGQNITINGGVISATGNGGIKNGGGGETIIGYTNTTDRITASNFQLGAAASSLRVKDGQYLISDNDIILYGGIGESTRNAIAGHTLSPYIPQEWSGNGTEQSPYIISSVDDLNLLCLRSQDNNYTNKYYKLGADITYTASTTWNNTESTESNYSGIRNFSGHFNGDGHTISGIRTSRSNDSDRGLFNYLSRGAVVENITLSNTRITGGGEIGGIAGYVGQGATIDSCHVTNTVDIHVYANYPGPRGGIAGKNLGVITNCISEATLSIVEDVWEPAGDIAGGIAGDNTHEGYSDGNLRDNFVIGANITCQSTHCGTISGKGGIGIDNYYYGCTVNGTPNVINMGCDGFDAYLATNGFVSAHRIDLQNAPNVTPSTASYTYNGINYWAKGLEVTLSGGLDGTSSPGCTKAYYVDGVALRDNYNSFIPKDSFTIPDHDVVVTVDDIHYDWYEKQDGTEADPYLIYFIDQLDLLATRVNSNYTQYYQGKYFKLMADLEYDYTNLGEDESNYTAIGGYYEFEDGHFDGNGHTISGIRIRGNDNYQGLFGKIKNAEVKNLLVFDTQINGASHIGVIAGNNDNSTLTNNYYLDCQVNGNATGVGCDGADVIANNGAVSLHTITVNAQENVSITTPATLTFNSTDYWAQGTTVTLSGDLSGTTTPGCIKAYYLNGNAVTLSDNSFAFSDHFTMPATNSVVTVGEIHYDWAIQQQGTQANPYLIYFPDQLDLLATRVNAGNYNSLDKYFKLMDNLTYSYTDLGETESNYTAIGNEANSAFRGHFDGNHKTIHGIRIRNNNSYQGIFGQLDHAEVTNLYVDDAEISGSLNFGGIVGLCVVYSVVTGCRVTGTSLIAVGNNPNHFGGIAGLCDGNSTLSNNLVVGITIPEGGAPAEGYLYGAIAGAGNSNVTLTNNYYRNCTVGSTPSVINVGCNGSDIEGAEPIFTLTLAEGINATATPTVVYGEVNYFKEGVTVTLNGGLEGTPAAGCQKAYMINDKALTENLTVINEFDMPNADVSVTVGEIPNDWATANAGTAEDPYRIYFTDQLDAIAARMVGGRNYYGKYFKLMNDLEYDYTTLGANESNYTAIGENGKMFSGHFDGNHKTIRGIRIRRKGQNQQWQGVFGYLDAAEITNLYLDDAEISGFQNVGGIAGMCVSSSVVTGCRVTGTSLVATESHPYLFGGIAGNASSSTLSNNLVVGITIPEGVMTYGAIAGTTATFTANYYRNCTVGSNQNVVGVGSNGSDIEGAKPIFTLNPAEGIVVTPDPTIVYNEVNYYEAGIEITLTVADLQYGYNYTYSVNNVPIGGNSFNIDADATITVETTLIDWTTAYDGTEDNPYLIGNAIQWNTLATNVNNGNTYDGKFFKLIDNIEISTMVGNSEDNSFRGTFNGDGHTLIFNYIDNSSNNYCAPFRIIKGATIKNLHVMGSIVKSQGKHAGGIVGQAYGTCHITSCWSSVDIEVNTNGDGSSGGIIGDVRNSSDPDDVYLTDCLFDGKLRTTSATKWGGMIGWVTNEPDAYFTNCLFAPQEVSTFIVNNSDSKTFSRTENTGDLHFTNSYYKTLIQDAQGTTNASSYSNGQLRAALGDGWELKMQGNVSWVVPVMTEYSFQGEGTEESPYLITSVNDWNGLSTNVYFGETYNGKYFQMTQDIRVGRMVGTYTDDNNYKAFSGTFDGDGHTLTINVSNQSRFAAPFKCVEGATIKNLHTAGTIDGTGNSDGKLLAGIVGVSFGSTSIIGCCSSASITTDLSNDAALAGIVAAYKSGVLTVEGCVFNGSMTASSSTDNRCGGIVGYRYGGSCSVSNSVFAPTALNVSTNQNSASATIARTSNDASVTINNCYYTQTLGTVQGSKMYSITPDENITMELYGIATVYNAIGLTFYDSNEGFQFNDKFYAAQGNHLELGLGYTLPSYTVNAYLANGNAINWSDQWNCYMLTMPAEDITITADVTLISASCEIAGYGNSNGGYHLIATPYESVDPASVAGMTDGEFDLYRFNQGADLEWENWKNDGNLNGFNLVSGKGYLYAHQTNVTLVFTGELYSGNGEVMLSKTTGVEFEGWNLVGNPFNDTAYIADGRDFYTMNDNGSELVAATGNSIAPMEGLFVIANQNEETMTFTTAPQAPQKGSVALNLSQGHGVIDRAIVRFGEGRQLPKFMLNESNTKVYIPQNNRDYAVVSADNQGEMPVSFKAKENGTYTLSFSSEEVGFNYLHLIDNLTGADIDLLQNLSYSFEAKITDYESRFKLVFERKEDNYNNNDNFAYFNNGELVVNGEGTLQVVDMLGHILISREVNSSLLIPHSSLTAGVYVLRLINGENVKTQKIVVE